MAFDMGDLTKAADTSGDWKPSDWASSRGLGDVERMIVSGQPLTNEAMQFLQGQGVPVGSSIAPEGFEGGKSAGNQEAIWNDFVARVQDYENRGGGIFGIEGLSTGSRSLDQALSYGQGAMWGGNVGGALATGGDVKSAAVADALALGATYATAPAAGANAGNAAGGLSTGARGAMGLNPAAGGATGLTPVTGGALSETSMAAMFPAAYSEITGAGLPVAPNAVTGQAPAGGVQAPPMADMGGQTLQTPPMGDMGGATQGATQAGTQGGQKALGPVDTILQSMRNNATLIQLGLSGTALAMSAQGRNSGQAQQAQQQLQSMANQGSQVAQQLLANYSAGQVSAAQQAQLDQVTQNTKNQLRQYFSSIGQADSTAAMQAMAQVDQQALTMKQAMLDNMLQQGLNAIGAASGPLGQVLNYQLGQDKQLKDAFGNFAGSLGRIFGQTSGTTSTVTPTGTPSSAPPAPPPAPQSPFPDQSQPGAGG